MLCYKSEDQVAAWSRTQQMLWHTHEPKFANIVAFSIVTLIYPVSLEIHMAIEDGGHECPSIIPMQICKLLGGNFRNAWVSRIQVS